MPVSKSIILGGAIAAMAVIGAYAYYSLQKQEELNLPDNPKVRKFVRELKRQVLSFCIYFVRDTKSNIKQEVTPEMMNLMTDQFAQVLSKIYQNKLNVLLSKKSITMEQLNLCLQGRDKADPRVTRDMTEINEMVNRAVRLEYPNLAIPEVYQSITPDAIYKIQREILLESTKRLCPLLVNMKKVTGKLDYIEFIKAMDALNLEDTKLAIMRKFKFPLDEEERAVEYFNKLDENLRLTQQPHNERMTALQKVYEQIMQLGMKEGQQQDMQDQWIQQQYSAV